MSTLMPMRRAASGSCAVARMALPMRLRAMKLTSTMTSGVVTAIASTSPFVTGTPAIVNRMILRVDEVRDAAVRPAEPEQADVLQDEREAHRGDQRRQLRRVAQWSVGHALDHHVQRSAGDHREEERERQAEDQPERPGRGREPDRPEERERREGADHEDVAVGEVDQLDDPVDQRVADGDQRPDGAVGEPVLDVRGHAAEVAVVLQITDAERDRHQEQQGDQSVLRDEGRRRPRPVGATACSLERMRIP